VACQGTCWLTRHVVSSSPSRLHRYTPRRTLSSPCYLSGAVQRVGKVPRAAVCRRHCRAASTVFSRALSRATRPALQREACCPLPPVAAATHPCTHFSSVCAKRLGVRDVLHIAARGCRRSSSPASATRSGRSSARDCGCASSSSTRRKRGSRHRAWFPLTRRQREPATYVPAHLACGAILPLLLLLLRRHRRRPPYHSCASAWLVLFVRCGAPNTASLTACDGRRDRPGRRSKYYHHCFYVGAGCGRGCAALLRLLYAAGVQGWARHVAVRGCGSSHSAGAAAVAPLRVRETRHVPTPLGTALRPGLWSRHHVVH
jgi:hypothetical protein